MDAEPGIQRIPAREQRIDLEPERKMQHVCKDACLDLRDVDRRLFLENAGLHAVVADAMTCPST